MAVKERKSRKELEEIVMREVMASGKCSDLASVIILGPFDRKYSSWDVGTASNRPSHLVSPACRIELNKIVGRLQVQYDLIAD
jgi:hypothetical protein